MSIVAWKVTDYALRPERREFSRETSAFYFYDHYGVERKEKKESSWWRYFTSEEDALAFIVKRSAAKAQRRQDEEAQRRLISAAPDLYELAAYAVDNPNFNSAEFDRMARAAIAKARGEA